MRSIRPTAALLASPLSLLIAGALAACSSQLDPGTTAGPRATAGPRTTAASSDVGTGTDVASGPARTLTLAFAGDVHFEGSLATLPTRRRSTLGPVSRALRSADVAMVNLESALTTGGAQTRKELEDADDRYWFRTPPSALGVLARSGVDVVTVANNHGADYGRAGLADTLRAADDGPLAVVGAGRDVANAYEPWRTSVRGTRVAVFGADASPRESADPLWSVQPGEGPGLAAARGNAGRLVAAVGRAASASDVVVVYLHWGEEYDSCPTGAQEQLAARLRAAGADVVVGSHSHRLEGSGLLKGDGGATYVSYGLGNFVWYHGNSGAETGVLRLRLRVQNGVQGESVQVVDDRLVTAHIPTYGGVPEPLTAMAAEAAVEEWRGLRTCTDLAPGPGDKTQAARAPLPPFTSSVSVLGPAVTRRMTRTHDPATSGCPVPFARLRLLHLAYVGFDGAAHTGVMVVAADVATDVVGVFRTLYRERFPLQRMRLVDDYGGDDDRSMVANNTSAYNCRPVAGTTSFSQHAYGHAVDIDPVQNPYLHDGDVLPPAGRPYADPGLRTDPSATDGDDRAAPGVITARGVVVRAFARIGWRWGGDFSEPDYQHFDLP